MKAILAILLASAALGFQAGGHQLTTTPATTQAASQPAIRFTHVDIFIDSARTPLAAWQLELKALRGDVKIVGIEGGEHTAFREPPYYDPAAMNGGRVILAAFSTSKELPAGRTRAARVHVMITGAEAPQYDLALTVAAGADGRPIHATASVQGDAG